MTIFFRHGFDRFSSLHQEEFTGCADEAIMISQAAVCNKFFARYCFCNPTIFSMRFNVDNSLLLSQKEGTTKGVQTPVLQIQHLSVSTASLPGAIDLLFLLHRLPSRYMHK